MGSWRPQNILIVNYFPNYSHIRTIQAYVTDGLHPLVHIRILSFFAGHQRPTQKYLNRYVKQVIGKKWYDLGIELLENDDIGALNNIQSDHSKDQEECCTKMFQLWLTKQPASWNQLIEALRNIKLNHLATSIEEMLLSSNPQSKLTTMIALPIDDIAMYCMYVVCHF